MDFGYVTIVATDTEYQFCIWRKSDNNKPVVSSAFSPKTLSRLKEAIEQAQAIQNAMLYSSDAQKLRIYAGRGQEELIEITDDSDVVQAILALG